MEPIRELSGERLIEGLREVLGDVPDTRRHASTEVSLVDALMSSFALFALKFPSLLKFEEARRRDEGSNLTRLFSISRIPSDTQMREILDLVRADHLRPAFNYIFRELQRGGELKSFEFFHGHYLMPLDGTGYFYSEEVHCEHCMQKTVQGKIVYYHQILAGAIVAPGKAQVIPLFPEGIRKEDGEEKNDCERNAARRFLRKFREDHPKLKVIVTEDALGSNGPHIKDLMDYEMSYILGVKPGSHKNLFQEMKMAEFAGRVTHIERSKIIGEKVKKEVVERYRFKNGVSLNERAKDVKTNFIEYWETISWIDQKGREKKEEVHFSWVTDLQVTAENVEKLMRGGRARWKIENETFNTLKNQGYEFEHNFGHGKENLSNLFAAMMMLVFLFDQAQEISCRLFQLALKKSHGKRSTLWETVRGMYLIRIKFQNYSELLSAIAHDRGFVLNTS